MPFDTSHPHLADRTGAGVGVVIVDSGVHAGHPHVGGVTGGIAITADGGESPDFTDRIGHGTAVAAAIREKAPGADLYAIRIFTDTLSAPGAVLVRAIDRALETGARLINLSLGTPRETSKNALEDAVERATRRGAIVVSAAGDGDSTFYPGSSAGAVGVLADPDCARHEIRAAHTARFRILASGFPRPIPGISPERNLHGVSFAVANTTGMLARFLETRPDIESAEALSAALR